MTGRQIREMRSLESQKRSEQDDKCGRRESREDSPLKTERFPEYVPIAQRIEPEHIHVIRQRGSTAEENGGKDGNNEEEAAATMATGRRLQTAASPSTQALLHSVFIGFIGYPHNTPSASASSQNSRTSGRKRMTTSLTRWPTPKEHQPFCTGMG